MANLSPEQERINREHIRHQVRDHVISDPQCKECIRVFNLPPSYFSTSRSKAYNAVHGTNIVNDEALDIVLKNEAAIRREAL